MRPLHNGVAKSNIEKIRILKLGIIKRLIAECFDFEEFVGRSDECTYGTRGTTTDQKLKRKALCSGLIMFEHSSLPIEGKS